MNTCTKVFLRKRPYAGGKLSLYLDYYPAIRNPHTNKMTRRETLGIVIFANPTNEMQRRFNQEMEEKAEAIRCIRYQSLIMNSSVFSTGQSRSRISSPTSRRKPKASMTNG